MLRAILFPSDSHEWVRVAYQPVLFLVMWIAGLLLLFLGDIFSQVSVTEKADVSLAGLPNVWLALFLISPPLALTSSYLIIKKTGVWRLRGLWLRLGADFGVSVALVLYLAVRIEWGDYHIVPMAALCASALFATILVWRDVTSLREVERVTRTLRRLRVPNDTR